MSRTRFVKGKYVKITQGDHNMSAEGHIRSNAKDEVREKGNKKGVSHNTFERQGSTVNEDFEITFSLKKDEGYSTVVPFGILDFEGHYENAQFAFHYTLMLSNIDSLDFKILNEDGSTLYAITNLPTVTIVAKRQLPSLLDAIYKNKPEHNPFDPIRIWDWKSILGPYKVSSDDYTKVGSYVIFWDGFDNNDVYDSNNFNNKKLKAQIIARKNGKEKRKEVEFSTERKEVDWVDVKIDRKNKKIDTTLRVNLQDGGSKGFEKERYKDPLDDPRLPPYKERYVWEKIPASVIAKWGKQPIKVRTKTFEDLKQLAINGINYHWGRNQNHAQAKDVKIVDDSYEVYIDTINSNNSAMDDIDLLYNTNYFMGRSNNPGCVSGFKSFLANLSQYIPYIPLSETIYYNVGYVNNVYKAESHFLFKESWIYIDETSLYKNGKSKVDMEYGYTCAHEIGHSILRAYSEGGGGSADYSYKHKGSSGYSETKPVSEGGVSYPISGEIDVMKYFNNAPYFLNYDFERIIAEDKDILGLIWLVKIEIK